RPSPASPPSTTTTWNASPACWCARSSTIRAIGCAPRTARTSPGSTSSASCSIWMTTTTTDPAFRLRLGTRRSALAMAQSTMVARELEEKHASLAVELVAIVTTGDVVRGDLAKHGGKGLFTRELESGLLDGSLDLAVHNLKDLPVNLPEGLSVCAYPERADPRDVLVSEVAEDLDGLPEGAVVLTGALRRRAQILMRRPDLRVEPVRGNVDTRLRKWRQSKAGGVILAAAGLARLSLRDLPAHHLSTDVLLP